MNPHDGTVAASDMSPARYRIKALPLGVSKGEWVTLVSCGKVIEADMVRSQLEGAGIEVFIPDENLMAIEAWALNAFGYIRVQVKASDYDAARALLVDSGDAVPD